MVKSMDTSYYIQACRRTISRNNAQYCKTLVFSEPFNLAKLAIEIKTLKIKEAKIK